MMKINIGISYAHILLQILIAKSVIGRSFYNHDMSNIATGPDNLATTKVERTKRNIAYDYNDYDEESSYELIEEAAVTNSVIIPPGLNIPTGNQTLRLTDTTREIAPDYMMDLYNRFTTNHLSHPSSNIVRSFININIEATQRSTITSSSHITGSKTRVHTLIFNITSISTEEEIDLAEIRLYTLVERDRNAYIGVDRKVSVFEVLNYNRRQYRLIDSKHIYGRHSGWETFDVSTAVRRWIHDINSLQILEIRIESVFHSMSLGDMDINTTPRDKHEPLLIVFSNDYQLEKIREAERHELITHEMDSYDFIDNNNSGLQTSNLTHNNDNNSQHTGDRIQRSKRRARNFPCRRKPMYVNFKDIRWDTWIIAPTGYQAYECAGKCYFPLNDNLSPTKHAIIQTLLHSFKPQRVSRACCVPTKLDPMSILYIDEEGVVTYKYKFDGMVVAECGCR